MSEDKKIIYNREEAYQYVLDEKHGSVSKLKENLQQEVFNDFLRLGYIKQGMDGEWDERWQLTEFGKEQMESYISLNNQTELLDLIFS